MALKGPEGEALDLSLYFMVTHQPEEENLKYMPPVSHIHRKSH